MNVNLASLLRKNTKTQDRKHWGPIAREAKQGDALLEKFITPLALLDDSNQLFLPVPPLVKSTVSIPNPSEFYRM